MRRDIDSLLNLMPLLEGIELAPPDVFDRSEALPDDLVAFWERYDGASLYGEAPYATRIFSPTRFRRTDEIMWEEPPSDTSSETWWIVADDVNGNDVSIDLSPDRLGRCYDTQIGRYGSPGDCPVIARSFTEFLRRSLVEGGRRFYWLWDDFASYGDAYDPARDVGAAEPRTVFETVDTAIAFLEARQPMAPDASLTDSEGVAGWHGTLDIALGLDPPDSRFISLFLGSIPYETNDAFYREAGLLLRRYPGEQVIPALIQAIEGNGRARPKLACDFAAGFRNRSLTERLLRALSDEDVRIRAAAASTLLVVGEASDVDALRRTRERELNSDVRSAIADVLAMLEDA